MEIENSERSRAEEITHEIECGGFTDSELDEIEEALEKARQELENEQ